MHYYHIERRKFSIFEKKMKKNYSKVIEESRNIRSYISKKLFIIRR